MVNVRCIKGEICQSLLYCFLQVPYAYYAIISASVIARISQLPRCIGIFSSYCEAYLMHRRTCLGDLRKCIMPITPGNAYNPLIIRLGNLPIMLGNAYNTHIIHISAYQRSQHQTSHSYHIYHYCCWDSSRRVWG